MKTQPTPSAIAIASLFSLLAHSAQAHEADSKKTSSNTLATVKVTEQAVKAPDPFTRELNMDYIAKTMPQDLDDLFRLEPSIQAGSGARNGQKLFMRGVEDLNLNVTVDGARQGQNIFHHQGRLQVDPFLLKRVDVKPGPAAADAGPGALGGSVVFETVDAQDLLKAGQTIGARLGGQYESSSSLRGGVASVYGKLNDNTGLLAYVRTNSNDRITAGGGEKVETTNGSHDNYLLKGTMLDLNGHSLRLSSERSEDNGGALRANFPYASQAQLVQRRDDQRVTTESHKLRYGYKPAGQSLIDTQIDFYDSTYALITELNNPVSKRYTSNTIGGKMQNTSRLTTGAVKHSLTYGIDYSESKNHAQEPAKVNRSEHANNQGLFLQNRMSWQAFRLSTGLRQDHYHASYFDRYQSSGTEVSPNISGEWDVLSGKRILTLFAGYGQSVRGDRLNQAAWLHKYAPDFVLGNNGQLKAEKAYQTEYGARLHDLSVLMAGDHAGLDLTLYDTTIANYLITDGEGPGAPTRFIRNASGDVRSKGFEVRAHWGIKDLLTSLSYSHNSFRDYMGLPGDTTGDSARVGTSVGDQFVWDTSWQWQPNWSLGYTLTSVDKLKDVRPGRPEKPAYTTHDIRMQWQPEVMKEAVRVTLAVENLFDEKYARHSAVRVIAAGQEVANWEAGRNLRLGVDWFF